MEFIPFREETVILNGRVYTVMQQEHHMLRQRRLELGMTQAQAAERAGILLRQYARLEGQPGAIRASGARILLSVCAVLKLDPYLFYPEIVQRAEETPQREVKIVHIPAKPSKYIPLEEYMELLRRVPAGKVVTAKTVEAYFCKKYRVDVIVIDSEGRFAKEMQMAYPFWRQLSANGQLYASTRFKSREQQKELLERDGLEVVPCGARNAGLKVKNYKKHLFDLDCLL